MATAPRFSLEAVQECEICLMAVSGDFSKEWAPKILGCTSSGAKHDEHFERRAARRRTGFGAEATGCQHGRLQVERVTFTNENQPTWNESATGCSNCRSFHFCLVLPGCLCSIPKSERLRIAGGPKNTQVIDNSSAWRYDEVHFNYLYIAPLQSCGWHV